MLMAASSRSLLEIHSHDAMSATIAGWASHFGLNRSRHGQLAAMHDGIALAIGHGHDRQRGHGRSDCLPLGDWVPSVSPSQWARAAQPQPDMLVLAEACHL